MTVAELIKLLQTYPSDMEVVVQSYEDGFDPVTDCRDSTVEKRTNREWYHGVYEQTQGGKKAVLIFSKYTRADADEVVDGNEG